MVDSAVVARGGVLKKRSIEKPRPLRTDPDKICLSEVLRLVEDVEYCLTVARSDIQTRKKTQQLKELLRLNGAAMEKSHKQNLDRLEVTMREACVDVQMDIITRLNVLEIIELRLDSWTARPGTASMFRQRFTEAHLDIDLKKIGYEGGVDCSTVDVNTVNNNTGTEIVAEHNNNEPSEELKYSTVLIVNGHKVRVSSSCDKIVDTSKDVLREFFSIVDKNNESGPKLAKPEICYEKEELLRLSKSPLCKDMPKDWEKIVTEIPYIVKKEGAPSKHFLHQMEVIKKQEAARKM